MGHALLPSNFYNLLELVCELYFLLRKKWKLLGKIGFSNYP
jgi:hypothetical protein